jgi:hypothetical protein
LSFVIVIVVVCGEVLRTRHHTIEPSPSASHGRVYTPTHAHAHGLPIASTQLQHPRERKPHRTHRIFKPSPRAGLDPTRTSTRAGVEQGLAKAAREELVGRPRRLQPDVVLEPVT